MPLTWVVYFCETKHDMAQLPYQSLNPATEVLVAEFPYAEDAEVDQALLTADRAFDGWRSMDIEMRAQAFERLAERLKARKSELAGLITTEMGKPQAQAEAEIDKCHWLIEFYAGSAPAFLMDEHPQIGEDKQATVSYESLGIVLGVMPWNFPFWQVMRYAVPALLAGNVSILKHAENVPQCASAIASLFEEAEFPTGTFQNLFATHEQIARLLDDMRVQGLTVTGSDKAGSHLASLAGKAIKKSVLELGGSDPFIVFADSDLRAAVGAGIMARYQNSGQSCIAGKRFLVEQSIYSQFMGMYSDAVKRLTIGDPSEGHYIGPMARADLRDQLAGQIAESERGGAVYDELVAAPEGPGFYHGAGMLTEVRPGVPAYEDEMFGPVATLMPFNRAEEAIKLANDSRYGLGAAVWTADSDRAQYMARALQCGFVAVNSMVKSDPRLPFGGVKQSGYGRELGMQGIREFTNIKTILQ